MKNPRNVIFNNRKRGRVGNQFLSFFFWLQCMLTPRYRRSPHRQDIFNGNSMHYTQLVHGTQFPPSKNYPSATLLHFSERTKIGISNLMSHYVCRYASFKISELSLFCCPCRTLSLYSRIFLQMKKRKEEKCFVFSI